MDMEEEDSFDVDSDSESDDDKPGASPAESHVTPAAKPSAGMRRSKRLAPGDGSKDDDGDVVDLDDGDDDEDSDVVAAILAATQAGQESADRQRSKRAKSKASKAETEQAQREKEAALELAAKLHRLKHGFDVPDAPILPENDESEAAAASGSATAAEPGGSSDTVSDPGTMICVTVDHSKGANFETTLGLKECISTLITRYAVFLGCEAAKVRLQADGSDVDPSSTLREAAEDYDEDELVDDGFRLSAYVK
jgi:hypothetical protein